MDRYQPKKPAMQTIKTAEVFSTTDLAREVFLEGEGELSSKGVTGDRCVASIDRWREESRASMLGGSRALRSVDGVSPECTSSFVGGMTSSRHVKPL